MRWSATARISSPILPYNVGTALLLRWLAGPWPPWWRSLTLMFQREVAERIVAKAGDEHYGRLAIAAQWRCEARIALGVHRSAFTPPPKVASAIVHLRPIAEPDGHRSAHARTADRRRLRPAPQDAASERQGHAAGH